MALNKEAPDLFFSVNYGFLLYNLGQTEEAKKIFDQQIEFSKESIRFKRFYATGSWAGMAYYYMAAIHASLGE